MYKRSIFQNIMKRMMESRAFIQVLAGPRQVGKTTLALQIKESLSFPAHYASADEPTLRDILWIEQQWEIARLLYQKKSNPNGVLLILDEVQKIPLWSDIVKKLWDEDSISDINIKVIILGSSTLLIQTGLSESLAGRFELIYISHWGLNECREAFGWTLNQFIYFGGYPGAAMLIDDQERWARYILDSIIETSISRDIMLMARIHKPALLRRVFELGCKYSNYVLSYQQMVGQLQDAGNVHTLAHYLGLLSTAGLVTGLQKFSTVPHRHKSSSPKLQVLNTALASAPSHHTFEEAQEDPEFWQRLIESAVGAHLINSSLGTQTEIFYWKEGNKEVDFVIEKGNRFVAVVVNTGRKRNIYPGIDEFTNKFKPKKRLIVGDKGMPLEEFFLAPAYSWL